MVTDSGCGRKRDRDTEIKSSRRQRDGEKARSRKRERERWSERERWKPREGGSLAQVHTAP